MDLTSDKRRRFKENKSYKENAANSYKEKAEILVIRNKERVLGKMNTYMNYG